MTVSEIIDRSEAQKAKRVETIRAELRSLGYSIVQTTVLAEMIAEARRTGKQEFAT